MGMVALEPPRGFSSLTNFLVSFPKQQLDYLSGNTQNPERISEGAWLVRERGLVCPARMLTVPLLSKRRGMDVSNTDVRVSNTDLRVSINRTRASSAHASVSNTHADCPSTLLGRIQH